MADENHDVALDAKFDFGLLSHSSSWHSRLSFRHFCILSQSKGTSDSRQTF
jgi:hypothetical protein